MLPEGEEKVGEDEEACRDHDDIGRDKRHVRNDVTATLARVIAREGAGDVAHDETD